MPSIMVEIDLDKDDLGKRLRLGGRAYIICVCIIGDFVGGAVYFCSKISILLQYSFLYLRTQSKCSYSFSTDACSFSVKRGLSVRPTSEMLVAGLLGILALAFQITAAALAFVNRATFESIVDVMYQPTHTQHIRCEEYELSYYFILAAVSSGLLCHLKRPPLASISFSTCNLAASILG